MELDPEEVEPGPKKGAATQGTVLTHPRTLRCSCGATITLVPGEDEGKFWAWLPEHKAHHPA